MVPEVAAWKDCPQQQSGHFRVECPAGENDFFAFAVDRAARGRL